MADRPNVLLICTDHWPGRMIGALGHPDILTPTLDAAIANGVAFTNAYTTTPMCVPARRALMTGTFSPTHGDRVQSSSLPMPHLPTMAQTFRDAGYQAYAVGKMHIKTARNRIGFDDVKLHEEGRLWGERHGQKSDDYELFLAEQGYAGMEASGGTYGSGGGSDRNWHLPDYCHFTDWTGRETARYIARRDPTRPAFWYMSFAAPHPPLTPLATYMDMYRTLPVTMPPVGGWAEDFDSLPFALKVRPGYQRDMAKSEPHQAEAMRGFYAMSTHVDHQIKAVIGTLKEEGILDDTIIMFTSDHGDMMGSHNVWNKMLFYEGSAKIPMVLSPSEDLRERVGHNRRDDRLVCQEDVMPTLLDLCGIDIPDSVEGISMFGDRQRDHLYSQFYEDEAATRSVHDGRHKLVYYPIGNRTQLFDLATDPDETIDLAGAPQYREVREQLTKIMVDNFHGVDLEWMDGDQLVGWPEREWTDEYELNTSHNNARGHRFK